MTGSTPAWQPHAICQVRRFPDVWDFDSNYTLMRTNALLTLSFLITLVFTGCAPNPADDVAKADVKDADEADSDATASDESGVTFVLLPESELGFEGSKVTGSHVGGFEKFTGSFQVDVENKKLVENGRHVVEIDMTSTWSDNDRLTGHLKSDDFFDVEKFPTATFVLNKAVETDTGYELSGTLDFHGVKKAISFPATAEVADDERSVNVKAEFAINRMDFGVEFPGKPDDLIREEVVIRFDVTGQPAA